jgi:hypothetical protein
VALEECARQADLTLSEWVRAVLLVAPGLELVNRMRLARQQRCGGWSKSYAILSESIPPDAGMAELADAADSKSSFRKSNSI